MKTEKWKFVHTEPDLVFNSKYLEFRKNISLLVFYLFVFFQAYPDKRKFHSCLKSNNDVYVFGGVYYTIGQDELTQVENRVWKLDLNTFKWKKLKIKMPKNTFFHASAITSVRAFASHCTFRCKKLKRNLNFFSYLSRTALRFFMAV